MLYSSLPLPYKKPSVSLHLFPPLPPPSASLLLHRATYDVLLSLRAQLLSERARLNTLKLPSNKLKLVFILENEISKKKEEKEGKGLEKGGKRRELIELLGQDAARFFGFGEIGKEGEEGVSLGIWTAKVVWKEEKLNYVGKLLVKQKMIK